MNGTAKKVSVAAIVMSLLTAGGGKLVVEMATDAYHDLRTRISENRDEMIDDNMWLIEHIEELEERLEALEAQ